MTEPILRFFAAATLLLGAGLLTAATLKRHHRAIATAFLLRTTLVAVLLAAAWSFIPLPRWNTPVTVFPAPVYTAEPAALPSSTPIVAAGTTTADAISQPSTPALRPDQILTVLFWLGVGGHLVYLLVGYLSLRRLRKTSQLVAKSREEWDTLQQTAAALQVTAPELRESSAIATPFLAGLPRPVLFVPVPLPFTCAEQRAAFAHELTHLRQGDLFWFSLARLQSALLWFHPLAHLLVRQLEQTAEEICDEGSLQQGIAARDYADFLLRLSEQPSMVPALTLGIAPFRSSVGKRIVNLLRAHRPSLSLSQGARGLIIAAMVLLFAAGVSLIGSSKHPHAGNGDPSFPSLSKPASISLTATEEKLGHSHQTPQLSPEEFVKRLLQPITLEAQNEAIVSVLKRLFASVGLPYHIDPGIRGTVSVDFKQVRLLDAVRDMGKSATPRFSAVGWAGTFEVVPFPPTGSITGRVLNPDRSPAANVHIMVQIQDQDSGTKEASIVSWSEANTDRNGVYRIDGLGPYRYNVAASLADYRKEDQMADANAPLVAAAIEGLRATPEKTEQAPDIHLMPGGIVQGTVRDRSGKPLANVDIGSYGPDRPGSSAMVLGTKTDSTGQYRMRVAPGRRTIYVSSQDHNSGQTNFDISEGETKEIDLTAN